MSDPETFLTVAEIAELLKLNPQTVRNWIDRGELSAVRVGSRRVRVKQSDLDRFIEAGATVVPVGDPEPGSANHAEAAEDELRDQLGVVLDATRSALDDRKLVALNALTEAARGLAQALMPRAANAASGQKRQVHPKFGGPSTNLGVSRPFSTERGKRNRRDLRGCVLGRARTPVGPHEQRRGAHRETSPDGSKSSRFG